MIKRIVASIKNRIPVYRHNQNLVSLLSSWKKGLYPPGHYYSPVTDAKAVDLQKTVDYDKEIPGVNLRTAEQFSLLEKLQAQYRADIFPLKKQDGYRYYFDNEYFSFSDGIFLHLLMRHLKPGKIVEIGSGFSSALMLDTNEKFLGNSVDLTFIEPYPEERLNKLLKPNENATVKKQFVQDVSLDVFRSLRANDMLFVDSSHVSKYRSDLNFILFDVLPVLQSGVIIHFHDVFFPFEYPAEWLKQGRSWNEAYLLRAFLQYNSSFEMVLFTSYLEGQYREWFEANMALCLTRHERMKLDGKEQILNTTGQSIYIRKK